MYVKVFFNFIILESKQQVLANLANFAYDPINFQFIRELGIVDIFLAQLSENNEVLLNFALAGLCNLSLGKFEIYFRLKEHKIFSKGKHLQILKPEPT